jgi:hypothetical protein
MKLIEISGTPACTTLEFPFDPNITAHLKTFPGVKWDSRRRCWSGHRSAVEVALQDLKASGLAKFSLPEPRLRSSCTPIRTEGLRRYQREDVTRLKAILDTYNGALLASVMGSGKSAVSLAVADIVAPDVAVPIFAPAIAIPHWRAQIARWCSVNPERFIPTSYAARGAKLAPAMTANPGLVILDEIHYCKNPTAKRSQTIAQLRAENPDVPFLGLSGTPMTARPADLWHVLDILHPGRWGTKWNFELRYCGGHNEELRIGEDIRAIWVADKATHTEELAARMSPIMVRRTAEDIAAEMPALSRVVHEIEIAAAGRKGAKISERTRAGIEHSLAAVEPFKLEAAVELAQEAIESGLRPLVVALHKDSAARLSRMLSCPAVTGDTPLESRRETLLAGGGAGVATMGSITTSIDLVEFDVLIFAGLAYIPSTLRQVEGRLVRMSRNKSVTAHYVVALGTFDEVVRQRVIDRLETSATLLGDSDDLSVGLAGGSEDDLIAGLLADITGKKK